MMSQEGSIREQMAETSADVQDAIHYQKRFGNVHQVHISSVFT